MSMYDARSRRRSPIGLLLMVLLVFGAWAYVKYAAEKSRDLALTRILRKSDHVGSRPESTPAALSLQEKKTIQIFRDVSPSVVSVANRALVRDFWGLHAYEIPRGTGSGFIWDRKGHIVSNFHVVEGASSITVTLADGTAYEAAIVGVAPDHDIALLKIDAPSSVMTPVRLGSSKELLVGQSVLAIGNPFGLDTSLSLGIVSALGRSIESMTGRPISDVIQTDAAINPGNSGGPLLDSSGLLIGINTAIVSPSGASSGIGFAVPVDTVKRVVPKLIRYGRVRRVGLGINVLPDNIATRVTNRGVVVSYVEPGSAAEKAGLRGLRRMMNRVLAGDIIVAIDGFEIATNDDLIAILDKHDAGDEVKIKYERDNSTVTTSIVLQHID